MKISDMRPRLVEIQVCLDGGYYGFDDQTREDIVFLLARVAELLDKRKNQHRNARNRAHERNQIARKFAEQGKHIAKLRERGVPEPQDE